MPRLPTPLDLDYELPPRIRLRMAVLRLIAVVFPWRRDKDYDGKPVHLCETAEDGWFHLAAGPWFPGLPARGNGQFEFVWVSPDGIHREMTADVTCPAWSFHGRKRRTALMRKVLDASIAARVSDDPSLLTIPDGIVELTRFKVMPGDVEYGYILYGEIEDPSLVDFVRKARVLPDSPLNIPGLAPLEVSDINGLISEGPYRHLLTDALRKRRWIGNALEQTYEKRTLDDRIGIILEGRTAVQALGDGDIAEILTGSIYPHTPISPWMVRWTDRWILKGNEYPGTLEIALLDGLPRSWLPGTREELDVLMSLARPLSVVTCHDRDGVMALLAHSKGRFAELTRRIKADIGPDRSVTQAISDIKDFLVSACVDLIAATPDHPSTPIFLKTMREAFSPDGGVRHLLALSERWHAVRNEHLRSRSAIRGRHWPRCTEDFTASSGCSVIELLDEDALHLEGDDLNHCVGGYGSNCMHGGSHVFSIRSDGRSLSTFEARFEGSDASSVRIVQHQGPKRKSPEAAAVAALEEWVSAVKAGSLRTEPRLKNPLRPVSTGLQLLPRMTFEQWRPFLSGRYREMTESEFRATLQNIIDRHLTDAGRMTPDRTIS